MRRNDARETMMQILYEMESSGELNQETVQRLAEERLAGNHVQRGKDLLGAIVDHLEEIDGRINQCSTHWKTTRMAKVDLAILRLAIGEIRYAEDINEAVAIDEAIRLAKKYSTAESSRFIHGVLGAVTKQEA